MCPVDNSKEHGQVPLLLSVIKDNDGDSVSELNFFLCHTPSNSDNIRVEWTLVELPLLGGRSGKFSHPFDIYDSFVASQVHCR